MIIGGKGESTVIQLEDKDIEQVNSIWEAMLQRICSGQKGTTRIAIARETFNSKRKLLWAIEQKLRKRLGILLCLDCCNV